MGELYDGGSTWVIANERGNAVAGRYCGINHATCSLLGNMEGCIFMPACGLRYELDGSLTGQGEDGYIWENNNGRALGYFSGDAYGGTGGEAYGFSVRCVRDAQ